MEYCSVPENEDYFRARPEVYRSVQGGRDLPRRSAKSMEIVKMTNHESLQRRLGLSILSVLAAAALTLGIVTPANAATYQAPESAAAASANLNALLNATEQRTVPVFSVERALSLGASGYSIDQYAASFVISGGILANSSTSDGKQLSQEASARAQYVLRACRGANAFTGMYWFGPQLALNSCSTNALVNGLTIAAAGGGTYAAAAALTGVGLPAGAVVGVVSGLLGVGVGILSWCRDASSIGAIYLNGGSPIAPPTCWAQ